MRIKVVENGETVWKEIEEVIAQVEAEKEQE
jgi:hypothetical protein